MQIDFIEVSETKNSVDKSKQDDATDSAFPLNEPLAHTKLKLHVLASGSRGNAAIIENPITHKALLVDCGICKRDFFDRCAEAGVDPASIEGIFITHEHTDHTKGLGVVTRGLAKQEIHPIIYASSEIVRASSELSALKECNDIRYFSNNSSISVGGITAHIFRTSHDASESFGFRFEGNEKDAIGYMTDTGIITDQAHDALKDCRVLAIESNHDKRMLETGPYPYVLKKRVASDKGHLSNDQAAEELEKLLSTNLEHVVAMHISENNNTYRLPSEVLSEILKRNGHEAMVYSAYQQRLVSIE